jgi:hypothetical protein
VNTVVLIVLIGVLSLMSAIAFIVVLLWALRRTSRDREAEMRVAYPDAELGPELGQYRGGSGQFPRARNTSWIVLTSTTLVVRPLLGNTVVLPINEISGTRLERYFNGHWNGRGVLVIETNRGEIGLTVGNAEQWLAALGH